MPILVGHFQGNFNRGSPAVGIKDLCQPFGSQLHQFLGQFNRAGLPKPQQCAVGYPLQLLANGLIDFRHTMTMHIAPEGTDAVNAAAAFRIDKEESFPPLDNDRFLCQPAGHRGKGMPQILFIQFNPMFRPTFHGLHCNRKKVFQKRFSPAKIRKSKTSLGYQTKNDTLCLQNTSELSENPKIPPNSSIPFLWPVSMVRFPDLSLLVFRCQILISFT